MAIRLNPYIGFKNNAREAMEYYHSIFGGNLRVSTFKDFGAADDPSEADLVMHSMLETDDGLILMASDTPSRMQFKAGSQISVSLSGSDEGKLRGYFEKLSDGGQVTMPMEKAPWGDVFGMCTDKYGIHWMVDAGEGNPPS